MFNRIILEDCQNLYQESLVDWSCFCHTSVLVTGACGMLPSYMIWMLIYLNEYKSFDIHITALCRDAGRASEVFGEYAGREYFHVVEADVTEMICMEEDLNYIIHAASPSGSQYFGRDPVGVIMPNVLGTRNTLELAREKKVLGYLYFSSGEVYGMLQKETIREEDSGYLDPMNVRSCYAESKRLGENLCKAYSHQYGVKASAVRPCHTFGPTVDLKRDFRVFSGFVSNVIHNQDLLMKSDGLAVRNFCYLYDAALAYFKVLLDGGAGEAYNVSNPNCQISIRGLAEILAGLYPEKGIKIVYANHDDVYLEDPNKKQSLISIEKLKGLGWSPKYSLEEGFRRTIESFI